MKRIWALLLITSIIGCNAQEKEGKQKEDRPEEVTETPKGEWKVHREYDEQGNLIRYDSIYSWSYSTENGEAKTINLDSIMDQFKGYFDHEMPFDWQKEFSYFPKNDSLFMKDFFKEDYFFENWQKHQADIERMIQKMDSTRNAFLKKYHPGLLDSGQEEKL